MDSATAGEFESDVMATVRAKRKKPGIALDMSNIKLVSTAGYRVLLKAAKEEEKISGGVIALANVDENIWTKLSILGFSPFFHRTTLIPVRK